MAYSSVDRLCPMLGSETESLLPKQSTILGVSRSPLRTTAAFLSLADMAARAECEKVRGLGGGLRG